MNNDKTQAGLEALDKTQAGLEALAGESATFSG
jgi:hypothetical protein